MHKRMHPTKFYTGRFRGPTPSAFTNHFFDIEDTPFDKRYSFHIPSFTASLLSVLNALSSRFKNSRRSRKFVFTPKEYTAATCLNGFKLSYKDQLILTLTGGFSKDNVTALTTAHANQKLDMTKSDKVSTGSRSQSFLSLF